MTTRTTWGVLPIVSALVCLGLVGCSGSSGTPNATSSSTGSRSLTQEDRADAAALKACTEVQPLIQSESDDMASALPKAQQAVADAQDAMTLSTRYAALPKTMDDYYQTLAGASHARNSGYSPPPALAEFAQEGLNQVDNAVTSTCQPIQRVVGTPGG